MRVLVALIVCTAVFAAIGIGYPAARVPDSLGIGLLLIALDVQPDHLRISEGLRVSNPGPRQLRSFAMILPSGATDVTFHRGLDGARRTQDGFLARVDVPTGVTEIAYSYALAAGRDAILSRTFPLPVRRIEVVVRGEGVRATVRGGSTLPPAELGGVTLRRWEVRDVAAGLPLVISLNGLPSRRSRVPLAAALALGVVLAAALLLSIRRSTPATR